MKLYLVVQQKTAVDGSVGVLLVSAHDAPQLADVAARELEARVNALAQMRVVAPDGKSPCNVSDFALMLGVKHVQHGVLAVDVAGAIEVAGSRALTLLKPPK